MTVTPDQVVEHYNVIEDIGPGQIPGFVYSIPDAFFFSKVKNDLTTALSQQLQCRSFWGPDYWPDRTVASRRFRTGCLGLSAL